MDKKVYVVRVSTESCDCRVGGYWETRPTERQIIAYYTKRFPDEFTDYGRLIFWDVQELTLQDDLIEECDEADSI